MRLEFDSLCSASFFSLSPTFAGSSLYDSGELAGGAEGISRYSHEHAGVVGCTLWTDCKGWSYGDAFNDFRLIQCGKKTFTSSEMERLHMKDKLEIARRGELG